MYNGTKLIINPAVARHLLKLGYNIIDIKPDKFNPDRTLFIFKWTKDIDETLKAITAKN
jgi:hypothetical protein